MKDMSILKDGLFFTSFRKISKYKCHIPENFQFSKDDFPENFSVPSSDTGSFALSGPAHAGLALQYLRSILGTGFLFAGIRPRSTGLAQRRQAGLQGGVENNALKVFSPAERGLS